METNIEVRPLSVYLILRSIWHREGHRGNHPLNLSVFVFNYLWKQKSRGATTFSFFLSAIWHSQGHRETDQLNSFFIFQNPVFSLWHHLCSQVSPEKIFSRCDNFSWFLYPCNVAQGVTASFFSFRSFLTTQEIRFSKNDYFFVVRARLRRALSFY